jgi:hypothetical protein
MMTEKNKKFFRKRGNGFFYGEIARQGIFSIV